MIPLVLSFLASAAATAAIDASDGAPASAATSGGTPPTPGASPVPPALPAGPTPPPPYPLASLTPRAGDPGRAARIRKATELFDRVWAAATGKAGPMPLPAKVLALAQAAAEGTGFGQGWDGEMAGSWNFGSYQAGSTQGGPMWRRVDHKDSRPDPKGGGNVEYVTPFRYYIDGDGRTAAENGALDFIRSITVGNFPALAPLTAGDVLWYCRVQYGNHYFEGFNLSHEGLAAYAQSVARLMRGEVPPGGVPLFGPKGRQIASGQPDGTWRATGAAPIPANAPTPEGVAGRIAFYAASMTRNVPEVAAAIGLPQGEPVPVVAGADLAQPWRPSYQAKAAPKAVA